MESEKQADEVLTEKDLGGNVTPFKNLNDSVKDKIFQALRKDAKHRKRSWVKDWQ